MNRAEIIIKMVDGHKVYTTYGMGKFWTVKIDNVDINPQLFQEMAESDNIICSHYVTPDVFNDGLDARGTATYKYDLAKIT